MRMINTIERRAKRRIGHREKDIMDREEDRGQGKDVIGRDIRARSQSPGRASVQIMNDRRTSGRAKLRISKLTVAARRFLTPLPAPSPTSPLPDRPFPRPAPLSHPYSPSLPPLFLFFIYFLFSFTSFHLYVFILLSLPFLFTFLSLPSF